MSANNPDITASDIRTDVEARLGSPGIELTNYLPWISYAYQRTYQALANTGQAVKEALFGNYAAVTLTNGTAEYTLSSIIPRYGGFIKVEILYGGTGDQRVKVTPLRSIAHWDNQANVSTSYRSKSEPVYYKLGNTLGIIPTPPASDASNATLYVWYIRRPYQITAGTDVIDIDYRFMYPIADYVQAKAIQKKYEDYGTAAQIERAFRAQLEEIAMAAASEFSENDGTNGVELSADTALYQDPLRW